MLRFRFYYYYIYVPVYLKSELKIVKSAFNFSSRPTLGPTQPPVQWVPGALSPWVKRGRGVTLTTYPHLVPRLRMNRSYTSSPLRRLHGV
jgi:hypothetical protein